MFALEHSDQGLVFTQEQCDQGQQRLFQSSLIRSTVFSQEQSD